MRIIKWLWRIWPLWGTLIIALAHYCVLKYFIAKDVHQWVSLLTQVFGVLFIIASINANLKIVREEDLLSYFKNWWNECPFRHKTVVANMQASGSSTFTGKARAFVYRADATVKEQIDYLQEQIFSLQKELDREIAQIQESIKLQEKRLHVKINEDVNKVSSKMHAVFKGIQIPIFGAILTVYSAIASFLSN